MGVWGSLAIAMVALCACGDNIHLGGGTLIVSPQFELRTTENGGTAMITVALANEPLGDVSVELASMDPTEGSVSPATITFTRSDYEQPQTVMLTGVDDDRVDGNQPYAVRISAPSVGAVDLDVVNQDDDMVGISVSPLLGLMTSEAGTTARFEVSLLSQPFAQVTVPLASTDPGEGMADRTSLTFTEENWFTPQEVVVTGQQDTVADGAISYTITVAVATSSDGAYNGLDPDDVAIQNIDDDVRGIAVVAPTSLATSEAGTQDSFTVVLQTQPTANVTIPVSSTDTGEATASTAQLVFTPSDWNVPQTVTVTGANDHIDDGVQPFTVTLGAATSGDATYDALDPTDVAGTNSDDDTASIVVSPTSGLTTSEAAGVDTFTVVLTSEPAADVMIAVSSTDSGEGSVPPTTLTFTPGDWSQPQTITITGVDDMMADGIQAYTIVLAPATSADSLYAGIDPSDVAVENLDDDTTGVTVDPVDSLFVSEFQDTDTFTIVLDSQPTANVTIQLSSSDTTEGTVSPSSVTFTAQNWNVPQTVTITGVDDALVDSNVLFNVVTAPAVSADPVYNGLGIPDVEVTNIDNDIAQVYVKARKNLRVSENGQSATFRVRLTLAPTATVTCNLSSSDTTEGLVSPQTLVFQTNQFGFQTVTVSGVDDAINDGDWLFTIVLDACTSLDANYNGANPRDVSVINRDNE